MITHCIGKTSSFIVNAVEVRILNVRNRCFTQEDHVLKVVEKVGVREEITAYSCATKVAVPKAPKRDPDHEEHDPIAKSFASLDVDNPTKRSGKRRIANAGVLDLGPDAKTLRKKLPKSFEVSVESSESSDAFSDPCAIDLDNLDAMLKHPKSKKGKAADDDPEDSSPKPVKKPKADPKPLAAKAEAKATELPKRRGEWWLTR